MKRIQKQRKNRFGNVHFWLLVLFFSLTLFSFESPTRNNYFFEVVSNDVRINVIICALKKPSYRGGAFFISDQDWVYIRPICIDSATIRQVALIAQLGGLHSAMRIGKPYEDNGSYYFQVANMTCNFFKQTKITEIEKFYFEIKNCNVKGSEGTVLLTFFLESKTPICNSN